MASETRPRSKSRHFDVVSPTFQLDPYPVYAALRREAPVCWNHDARSYLVSRYRDVRAALLDGRLVRENPLSASRRVFGATLLDMEGPRHSEYRALLAGPFSAEHVRKYRRITISSIIDSVINDLPSTGPVDLVSRFAERIPIRVISAVLGLPTEEADWIHSRTESIAAFLDDSTLAIAPAIAARTELVGLVERFSRTSEGRQESVATELLSAADRTPGLTKERMAHNVALLFTSGTLTTAKAIANTLVCLFRHPDDLERLRCGRLHIRDVTREVLRWESPLHGAFRFARESLTIDGVEIPKGSPVYLISASANRDESVFDAGDEWNPDRPERCHLAFGSGQKACFGALLATAEIEVAISSLLKRFRIEPLLPIPPLSGRMLRGPTKLPVHIESLGGGVQGVRYGTRQATELSIRRIYTLGPTGTNCEAAAFYWFERRGISGKVILRSTLEDAVVDTIADMESALLGCIVYPNLHHVVFDNLERLRLVDCFVCETREMVLAARDVEEPRSIATHVAPAALVPSRIVERVDAKSNAHAAQLCEAGVVESCITTREGAVRSGLKVIASFGRIPMGFSIHVPVQS
jgi:cytochrome P450